MIQLNLPTPPAMPSNEALSTALIVLAVAADAQATKSRLGELIDQLGIVRAAHDELAAAHKAVEDEQAKLADLHEREKALADRQAQLDAARLQNDNAASALAAREAKIAAQELAMAKARDEIAAREKALAAKLASYRQALA